MLARVPDQASYRPGGSTTRLAPTTIPVRVSEDVRAAGTMTMTSDARVMRTPATARRTTRTTGERRGARTSVVRRDR